MGEITLDAIVENIPRATEFADELMEAYNCPMAVQTKIDLAIDEVFGNIAHYAYAPGTGKVTMKLDISSVCDEIVMTFLDTGVPHDPLCKADPDTTLSADERSIGGLGIFLVKKLMDSAEYEYRDGMNVLTLRKRM